jgi:hypothetical protein
MLLLATVSAEGLLMHLPRSPTAAGSARNLSANYDIVLQAVLVLQAIGSLATLVLAMGAEWRLHALYDAVEWYPVPRDGIIGQ